MMSTLQPMLLTSLIPIVAWQDVVTINATPYTSERVEMCWLSPLELDVGFVMRNESAVDEKDMLGG